MKVLYLDIETRAAVVNAWGLWDQNIGLNQIDIPVSMICFAAKWADKKRAMFFSEFHDGHEEMVKKAHELLDEADVLVTWNGRSFDEKHLNREFLEAGLTPPSPFKSLDLMAATKRKFRFMSNKLDWVAQRLLEGDHKVRHSGFDLWRKCLEGDEKAWALMKRYNKKDVTLLQDLHEKLLPWIDAAPNVALIDGAEPGVTTCTRCGSTDVQYRGWAYTTLSKYHRFQCNKCGGWGRDRTKAEGSITAEAKA